MMLLPCCFNQNSQTRVVFNFIQIKIPIFSHLRPSFVRIIQAVKVNSSYSSGVLSTKIYLFIQFFD